MSKKRKIYLLIPMVLVLAAILAFFEVREPSAEAEFFLENSPHSISGLIMVQENSLFPLAEPSNPEPPVIRRIQVVITGYSSTLWETDGDPYLTAAGTRVRDGVIANNILPFGTKIRIPEIFGNKIFVVEDRMSWKKGNYQVDVWFPDYWKALNFGAKRTYIEILES